MKLKVDENGHVVLQDGMPVYVHDDGKEVPFDGAQAFLKIKELNAESKAHREAKEKAETALKAFEGLDPAKAREAMTKLRDLDDGKLVEAGKVEELRKSITKQVEDSFTAKFNQVNELLQQKDGELEARDKAIHRLLIKGAFDTSTFLKEKTVLLPEFAFEYFGKFFTVETVDGELRAVAKRDGQPILSRTNPGAHATAEEAIEFFVENHPQKESLLKAPPAKGGGAQPGKPGTPGGAKPWQELHKEALARGDTMGAIAIKRQGMAADAAARK